MSRRNATALGGLGLAALWIWCRDLGWVPQANGTLPILLSLAWYGWLVNPWEFEGTSRPVQTSFLATAVVFLVGGTLSNLTLLLAISWAIALYAWIQSTFSPTTQAKAKRLLILTVMAFPWMALDGDMVSTIFRLSAAHFTESTSL